MLKFRTNARCAGCSAAIAKALSSLAPATEWEIDLASPDRILTYSGAAPIAADDIMEAVRGAGFKIELLD